MTYREYLERSISFLRFQQDTNEITHDIEMEIQQLEEELEDLEMD